jgi:hypothetical protein
VASYLNGYLGPCPPLPQVVYDQLALPVEWLSVRMATGDPPRQVTTISSGGEPKAVIAKFLQTLHSTFCKGCHARKRMVHKMIKRT